MTTLQLLSEAPFARDALLTGVSVATVCSLLSVVVVLKRMAFIGQGISHAGFGGVGTAVFFGLTGLARDGVVFVFCLATALVIGLLARRRRMEHDSAIGILLAAAMAWGVLLDNLSLALQSWTPYVRLVGLRTAQPSYETLLFGSLLNVSPADPWIALGLSLLVLGVCALLFKEIVFFAFDEASSRVFGVPVAAVHLVLLILLSLTIVMSMRLAGFILVSALLVIPGAAALQLARSLAGVLIAAWVVGMLGMVGGLVLAFEAERFSSGACIVAVLAVLFAAAYAWRRLLEARVRRPAVA